MLAVAIGIGRFVYTPLLPAMQADAGFGAASAGWIAGWNYLGYLVGALGASLLAGRASRRAALLGCLAISLTTTAAMAATTSIPIWCALRLVSGIASAGALVISSSIVLEALTRAGRPELMGVNFAGVGAGIAISGLVVAVGLDALGWRGLWIALAGLSVAALAILGPALWRVDGISALPASSPAPIERFPGWILVASYFLEGLGYVVTGTFLVAIAKAMPGLGAAAQWLWIVVGIAAVPSSMLWSRAAKRIGAPGALVAAHLVQAAGIALPLLSGSLWVALISAACFGGTFVGITSVILAYGGRVAPGHPGRIIGLLTAAFGLGQMAGPVIAGWLAERQGSFDSALAFAALVVALGAALIAAGMLAIRRP